MSSKAKQPVGKLKSSPSSNVSGVKFLKAFAPSIRRRRQCDKGQDPRNLEIYNLETTNNENFNVWDSIPVSPITPPAAFQSQSRLISNIFTRNAEYPWSFTFTPSLNEVGWKWMQMGLVLFPFAITSEISPSSFSH